MKISRNKYLVDSIVTADLESLIRKDNSQLCYMAAWYGIIKGVKTFNVFDISQYDNNPLTMLSVFWMSLINKARGCTVYFHNWAGYDIYLSLAPLLSLTKHGFTFHPIVQNGKVISLTIRLGKELLLTIKDSIKLLPGALGKLAKDFGVEQQKELFPHYFNPLEKFGTLDWTGTLPPYNYFEPRRTSFTEWEAMATQFRDHN